MDPTYLSLSLVVATAIFWTIIEDKNNDSERFDDFFILPKAIVRIDTLLDHKWRPSNV